MESLGEMMSDPVFWISNVVVALIVGLATSYAKPMLDNAWAGASKRARAASERRQRSIDEIVAMAQTDAGLALALHLEGRWRHLTTVSLGMAGFLAVIYVTAFRESMSWFSMVMLALMIVAVVMAARALSSRNLVADAIWVVMEKEHRATLARMGENVARKPPGRAARKS